MKNLFKFFSKGSSKKIRPSYGREIVAIMSCVAFYNFIDQKVIGAALTKGRSMEPTLSDSNVVIVDRFFFKHFKFFSQNIFSL